MDIQEEEMLDIIKTHSNNNPYVKICPADLKEEERIVFSNANCNNKLDTPW